MVAPGGPGVPYLLLMPRNRTFKFLSWNMRGLNGRDQRAVVRKFIRHCRCGVICLQETKLVSTSLPIFRSICGYHIREFRSLDAVGSRGGLLTAWNPSLYDCTSHWAGVFSLSTTLRRRVDGSTITVSNIYGPTGATHKEAFLQELRALGARVTGVWALMGDFNILLSLRDKNGPPSHVADMLAFRNVINDLGLFDLPIHNQAFTWTNGRPSPTLERLDRVFFTHDLLTSFPRSVLRALPRPRSDHSPLMLTAFSFIQAHHSFRFE